VAEVPHLLNVPDGKAGLVINWHIDANPDYKSIPWMEERGYLLPGIDYSMHVTAGDFRNEPGDGLGFDAAGAGRPFLEKLLRYGVIGSHGGWGHDWFSDHIERGLFDVKAIEMNIQRNNDALQQISGARVREYSAPNGVYPQPRMTQILEKLGFVAYYYTGDCGSAPNRTFINGRRVSDRVWAFPIMPLGKAASLEEMAKAGLPEREVTAWLKSVVDYVVAQKTVRLIYSHPYDIEKYPRAVKALLEVALKEQKAGRLQVKPMSYFADYLSRFVATRFQFTRMEKGWRFQAQNERGLEGMVLSLPKTKYRVKASPGVTIREEGADWLVRLAPSGKVGRFVEQSEIVIETLP
jgi:hypothetical protein